MEWFTIMISDLPFISLGYRILPNLNQSTDVDQFMLLLITLVNGSVLVELFAHNEY